MPYISINPRYLEKYFRGDSVYLGPTASVNYRVMSTRVDPDTGELQLTGMREQQGEFPVLPGMFLSWIGMGIINFLVGKLFSLFGFKTNPLELRFHYGVLENQGYSPPAYRGNGNNNNGNHRNGNGIGNGYQNWEDNLAKELYPLD